MGRFIFGGVGAVVLGAILWLELGESYKERATALREAQVDIESRGKELSTWADELDEQQADLVERESTLEESAAEVEKGAAEVEKREAALEQLAEELEERSKSALRGSAPAVVGKYAIVIDVDTGIALYEKNADHETAVASTQKLMTGLLVAEAGELEATVRVEAVDTRVEPTILGVKPGDEYVRKDLLQALLVKSGNDLAMCLARDNAGSVEAFAEKMNQRAEDLGMTHSHFLNPHGLTEKGQHSTARDMSKLAMAVYDLPVLREIVSTPKTVFEMADGTSKPITNTNRVLRSSDLCDGMKTGYTIASGHCLVCSGEHEGRRRIVVMLGSNRYSVWKDSQALLEWALKT